MQNNEFISDDLELCSYLILRKIPLCRIDSLNRRKRFIFKENSKTKDVVNDFLQDCPLGDIGPKTILSNLRTVRNLIHTA